MNFSQSEGLKVGYVHATNHFFDSNQVMIPESAAILSSGKKYKDMDKALSALKSPREILDDARTKL